MLNGYVTYKELKLITGFNDHFLSRLIIQGLRLNQADLYYNKERKPKRRDYYCQEMFNLKEVEQWLKAHIF